MCPVSLYGSLQARLRPTQPSDVALTSMRTHLLGHMTLRSVCIAGVGLRRAELRGVVAPHLQFPRRMCRGCGARREHVHARCFSAPGNTSSLDPGPLSGQKTQTPLFPHSLSKRAGHPRRPKSTVSPHGAYFRCVSVPRGAESLARRGRDPLAEQPAALHQPFRRQTTVISWEKRHDAGRQCGLEGVPLWDPCHAFLAAPRHLRVGVSGRCCSRPGTATTAFVALRLKSRTDTRLNMETRALRGYSVVNSHGAVGSRSRWLCLRSLKCVFFDIAAQVARPVSARPISLAIHSPKRSFDRMEFAE